jgi:hypothetical protein
VNAVTVWMKLVNSVTVLVPMMAKIAMPPNLRLLAYGFVP